MMKRVIAACVLLVVAVASEQSHIKTLTGTAGQSITLHTGVAGLHGDVQVIWTYGPQKNVLLNIDNGHAELNTSQRYHLDTNSGSLTIQPLSINDSGLYQGRIISAKGSMHSFNLTVVEAGPAEPAGPLQDLTADQRDHVPLYVSFGLFGLFIVLLVCAVTVGQKKMKDIPSDGADVYI